MIEQNATKMLRALKNQPDVEGKKLKRNKLNDCAKNIEQKAKKSKRFFLEGGC